MGVVTELRYSKSQYNLAKYRYTDEKGKIVDEQTHFDTGYTGGITLMQYTGLKDDNGTKICEGDIGLLVWDGEETTLEVVFDLEELTYVGRDIRYGVSKYKYLSVNDEIEIIGNKYENSDLLQEVTE